MNNNLHGIVFAYQSDAALRELTQHRHTGSIPFGGRYRLVDFVLSNMVNAGVSDVGLIVHTSYQSLLDHVGSGKDYDLSRKRGGLKILPPFSYASRPGSPEYAGHMDALAGVCSYLERIRQDYVVLAGSDLVANLPLGDMLEAHLKSGADITALCAPEPTGRKREATYLTVGADGLAADVVLAPKQPSGCESLEVYILSKKLLLELVHDCEAHGIMTFGKGVLQAKAGQLRIAPFFFEGYFAHIQSVQGYFAASKELLDADVRRDLFLPARPIRTKDFSTPSTYYGPSSVTDDCLIADGCIIEGRVENCVLFRDVIVKRGAVVRDCVLMQGTEIGVNATISYVVADKNVKISDDCALTGHENYPIAIGKYEVV